MFFAQAGASATILESVHVRRRQGTRMRTAFADASCGFAGILEGSAVHNLGQTRSSHQRNHLLLTPDTLSARAARNEECFGHRSYWPALGAAFTEYTAEFEPKGELGIRRRSVLLRMEGRDAGAKEAHELGARGYAYLPEGCARSQRQEKSRVAVMKALSGH